MHGVKRLFAWMIPRFDRSRFQVSLVSLRKRDLSEETLDSLGIDITYLEKSKFDASTLPALLKVIDRKQIDILHLHGYGATTFGRIAAAMRGLPVVLHEHANLTSTPWFQKIADRLLERYTDLAIAVSQSTAEFVIGARLVRPDRVRVVYLGAPVGEFSQERSAAEVEAIRHELGIVARRAGDRDRHAVARLEGQRLSRQGRAPGAGRAPECSLFPVRRRAAAAGARSRSGLARAGRPASSSVDS